MSSERQVWAAVGGRQAGPEGRTPPHGQVHTLVWRARTLWAREDCRPGEAGECRSEHQTLRGRRPPGEEAWERKEEESQQPRAYN